MQKIHQEIINLVKEVLIKHGGDSEYLSFELRGYTIRIVSGKGVNKSNYYSPDCFKITVLNNNTSVSEDIPKLLSVLGESVDIEKYKKLYPNCRICVNHTRSADYYYIQSDYSGDKSGLNNVLVDERVRAELTLTSVQKVFIQNNKNSMTTLEMAKILFNNPNLGEFDFETEVVNSYLKKING